MKKIDILGLSITFKLNRRTLNESDIYTKEKFVKEKIIYLLVLLSCIVLSLNLSKVFETKKYHIGEVATSDIYAPKTISYNDKDKKDEIIKEMIENSKREYIYVSEAEKLYVASAEYLFDEVLNKKKNKSGLEIRVDNGGGHLIPKDIINTLLKMKEKELEKTRDDVLNFLQQAYSSGIIGDGVGGVKLTPPNDEILKKMPEFEQRIINNFLAPNYIYDEARTKNSIAEKISQIQDQIVEIRAGTLLVKKGEIITERKWKILSAIGMYTYNKSIIYLTLNIVYLIVLCWIFYPLLNNRFKIDIRNKKIYRSLLLIYGLGLLSYRFIKLDHIYSIPFEAIYFLMEILFPKDFALLSAVMGLSFIFPLVGYDPVFIILTFSICIMGVYLIEKVTTRQDLIALGLKLAVIKFLIYILLTYFVTRDKNLIVLQSSEIIISGLFSGMLTISLLPYFEKTFNILTKFKLLELGDLSHPLLKLLSTKAPGTFHHSMMVATLSEAGAEAIGADSIFARVASYYHDIGKMRRPKFYVENQEGGENPHNKISPFLSTMIITAHTKEGVELGREYGIPKEIRDIMREHQGTTLLAYFYNKAKQLDPSVSEDDFRYSGPVPKSKESAIIMLADSVEAAVRSLDEKTPMAIENILRKIFSAKIEDNQLSEANLTFKEIEVITKTFVKVLMSIHHSRIKYPGQK